MDIESVIEDRDFFAETSLFTSVAPDSIEHYLKECSTLLVAPGSVVLAPNAESGFLYVIIEGEFEVKLDSLERPALTTLRRGDCFGEMSMIEQNTPSAFVQAKGESMVLVIPHDALWAMVGASHAIARNLLVILSGRLRTDNAIIADSAVIIRHFQKKSFTDPLTGLYNRRWMEEFFSREIGRCQMNDDDAVLAIVDVDHFRSFNNSFGHLVGDLALGAVTEALTKHFRADDLIARYGGDEFVILLPRTALDRARDLSERVRGAIALAEEAMTATVPNCLGITVSIGIAAMEKGDTLATLLARADDALFRSKKRGRDRVSE